MRPVGDEWELLQTLVPPQGTVSSRGSRVKGHAGVAVVSAGAVRGQDLRANRTAYHAVRNRYMTYRPQRRCLVEHHGDTEQANPKLVVGIQVMMLTIVERARQKRAEMTSRLIAGSRGKCRGD